jgi:hypothetical protein
MNLIFGFIMVSVGSNLDLTCTVAHSDIAFLRDSKNLEENVSYVSKGALVNEKISLNQDGYVTISKYGKDITLQMSCKRK